MPDRPKVPLWAAIPVTWMVCAAGNVTIGMAGAGWPWMAVLSLVVGAVFGMVSR